MTIQVTDSENVIRSLDSAPDKLRGEIGQYYTRDRIQGLVSVNFQSGKIKTAHIEPQSVNNQILIPTKKSTITIEGEEGVFRDHTQWNNYISETIVQGRNYLDHSFSFNSPSVSSEFFKNFHHPDYEDNTKSYPSNQLLNYNLISYPYDSETIQNIGYIKTQFDQIPTSLMSASTLMDQYPNRMLNYTGSILAISTKQRNIFRLTSQTNNKTTDDFPFYYQKKLLGNVGGGFLQILRHRKKLKHLFKSIKKDLSFANRSFNIGNAIVDGKIYNAINLLTSTSLIRLTEESDELFILPENEINHSDLSERFVNQINAVRFLSEMREEINTRSRTIEQIFNCANAADFLLGFKIEKYLDNDATRPIQTYYTITDKLVDTQLKYGRKYIYKTKALVGIFGSSYSYENLQIAQSEADEGAPTSEKYWAKVDLQIRPSFQILEYEIDVDETAFIDTPMLTPYVTTYGRKDKAIVNFLFQPRFFTLGEKGDVLPPVGNLRPSDEQINNLYSLAGDLRSAPDYFTGIYEIYRLKNPPQKKEDFSDGYLTTVDESILAGNLDKTSLPIENIDIDYARFTDKIIPNQKYYYAFRSLTYHGTPSQLTEPVEVELQRDSDEYKILVSGYQYPQEKDYNLQKKAKRLIRIVPNIERLLFSLEEDKNNWELDDGMLVSKSTGANKTFKIRITSKHTGKKIDLNVTFKLKSDDTFN